MSQTRPARAAVRAALAELRIQLLGGFAVLVGDRVVAGEDGWRLRKAKSLVKVLALAPGKRLHRERVVELLWPDLAPAQADNNLRQALHVARRILARAPELLPRLEGEAIALGDGSALIDVDTFRAEATAARRGVDPQRYRSASQLYAGELLPDDRYEDWASGPREELHGLFVGLLLDLARILEDRGDLPGARAALERVVQAEQTHEDASLRLMRALALLGERHEALRRYHVLRATLRREFDARPSPTAQALYRQIAAGRFPPEPRAGSMPDHLPVPPTSFVGREAEQLDLERILAEARLVTITGTAGCGKTRLAVEVARALAARYVDGAWLVELASVHEPTLVPRVVAARLGVREHPGEDATDALLRRFRDRAALLVLDNCEHVLEACQALVARIVRTCARVRMLATSREALGPPEEVRYTLAPLAIPPQGSLAAHEAVRIPSVRLFLDRARSVQPRFALEGENVRAVLEICRRLDGLPLAIELAASHLDSLAPEAVAAALADPLALLRHRPGAALAPGRFGGLRGAIDRSYDLLPEPERAAFALCAVFAGGGRGARPARGDPRDA